MKRNRNNSSEKFRYTFARLSTWTGYFIGLLVLFILMVNKNPEAINLVPVAKLFFEAAKISVELQKDIKKLDKPANHK
ncbi:MAG: hypothetical protein QNJ63_24595 [Calothrix sp. MO_192.B10]|nr:hypothetical protein [Calothrix sp. MO_192.B10]